jgi:hypothetical protein
VKENVCTEIRREIIRSEKAEQALTGRKIHVKSKHVPKWNAVSAELVLGLQIRAENPLALSKEELAPNKRSDRT